MKRNDVLVFSIALGGYSRLFHSCLESQKRYCAKFGYQYVLVDRSPRKLKATESAWLKVYLLKLALECNYKWIAFLDADCEVRDHTPSFVDEMSRLDDGKCIFLCHGFSGRINSGVIILKNTQEAYEYLRQVINNRDHQVPDEDKALYENGHMIYYGKNNANVKIIDAVKWNNNLTLNQNSYIQHYSGGILREDYLKNHRYLKFRINILKKLRNKIKNFFHKNSENSVEDIAFLLSFYLKNFPLFNCRK